MKAPRDAQGRQIMQEWDRANGCMGRKYVLVPVTAAKGAFGRKDGSRYNLVKQYI